MTMPADQPADEIATITFDRPKVERLRTAFTIATTQGQEQFDFDGRVFVTAYAKYLLQHLENQFQIPPARTPRQ
jgi:hypothetical protein